MQEETPQHPRFPLLSLHEPGRPTRYSGGHGVHSHTVFCFVDAPRFLSPLPDSRAPRAFPGLCFSRPGCCEFPHAGFLTPSSIPGRGVPTGGFAGLMTCVAAVHSDSDHKSASPGRHSDLYSPPPHCTVPASPSPPTPPVLLLSELQKLLPCTGSSTSPIVSVLTLMFPFLSCDLSVQIPRPLIPIGLPVFGLWVVGTPYVLRKLPLCAIFCNFYLVYYLSFGYVHGIFSPRRKCLYHKIY